VFLIDDLLLAPGKAVLFLFEELAKKARDEWLDDGPVKEQLQEIYTLLESGRISEREFEAAEYALVQRLEEIARAKGQETSVMESTDTALAAAEPALPFDAAPALPPPAMTVEEPAAARILSLIRQAFDAAVGDNPQPVLGTAPGTVPDPSRDSPGTGTGQVGDRPGTGPELSPLAVAMAVTAERPAVPVTAAMTISQVINAAMRGLSMLNLKVSALTSVARHEDGWRVTAEVIERRSVPDTSDLLGLYELRLDGAGNIVQYERTRMRRRCDLGGR